jgi:hypothetical protein
MARSGMLIFAIIFATMSKGNKQATGRKTSEPLLTMRFGSPKAHIEELGYKEAQKIARVAANEAILTAFRAKINNNEK